MQKLPIVSSNLSAIGHDPRMMVLEVEFKNGSVYQYSGVSSSVYDALVSADSHGNYFNTYIKDSYSCSQVI